MFRLIPLLMVIPTVAAADWTPRPAMFSYDATFDLCTADPTASDLVATCADKLAAAYVLKRATAVAAVDCLATDVAACAVPFEDQGLPAIAMRIAVDVGCNGSNIQGFPENVPLPNDHCIVVASDIMLDEGIVPLFTDLTCRAGVTFECDDLVLLQAQLWKDAIFDIAKDDTHVFDLVGRIGSECAQAEDFTDYVNRAACATKGYAALWADFAQQTERAN